MGLPRAARPQPTAPERPRPQLPRMRGACGAGARTRGPTPAREAFLSTPPRDHDVGGCLIPTNVMIANRGLCPWPPRQLRQSHRTFGLSRSGCWAPAGSLTRPALPATQGRREPLGERVSSGFTAGTNSWCWPGSTRAGAVAGRAFRGSAPGGGSSPGRPRSAVGRRPPPAAAVLSREGAPPGRAARRLAATRPAARRLAAAWLPGARLPRTTGDRATGRHTSRRHTSRFGAG